MKGKNLALLISQKVFFASLKLRILNFPPQDGSEFVISDLLKRLLCA